VNRARGAASELLEDDRRDQSIEGVSLGRSWIERPDGLDESRERGVDPSDVLEAASALSAIRPKRSGLAEVAPRV
jgi:hypothetical protein